MFLFSICDANVRSVRFTPNQESNSVTPAWPSDGFDRGELSGSPDDNQITRLNHRTVQAKEESEASWDYELTADWRADNESYQSNLAVSFWAKTQLIKVHFKKFGPFIINYTVTPLLTSVKSTKNTE